MNGQYNDESAMFLGCMGVILPVFVLFLMLVAFVLAFVL